MTLVEVVDKEVSLSTFQSTDGELRLDSTIKRCHVLNDNKYKIDFFNEGKRAGYLTFRHNSSPYAEFEFIGISVDEPLRGKDLSKAFLETFFSYAELNQVEFSSTSLQRKPLTTHLLTKFGYESLKDGKREKVSLARCSNGRLGLYFEDFHKAKEFSNSNLMKKSGQYELLDEVPSRPIGIVYLRSQYGITDFGLLEQKRGEVRKKFSFS